MMDANSPAILEIMQLLIQAGANVNARSGMGNGSTPVFDASAHKDQLDFAAPFRRRYQRSHQQW